MAWRMGFGSGPVAMARGQSETARPQPATAQEAGRRRRDNPAHNGLRVPLPQPLPGLSVELLISAR
jgi:hypothetical protein